MNHPAIDILNASGLGAQYTGTTHGGEWHAPCPVCRLETGNGGKDRLCVWPKESRAWCRRCEQSFSLPELLAETAGIDVAEARNRLPGLKLRHQKVPSAVQSWPAWQARVEKIVEARMALLEQFDGKYHLKYLVKRGLTLETIRRARLGCNVIMLSYPRDEFGLTPESHPETGKPRSVYLPQGILIPYLDLDERCVKLQVRCDDERYGRYRNLPGSRAASMVLMPEGEVSAVVLLESALDALLCQQEGPENFAFVALGSTNQMPDRTATVLLREVPHVLVATDSDEAGAKAWAKLEEWFPKASRLIVPPGFGKDIGEAYLAGLNVRDWCESGVELAAEGKKRPPEAQPRRSVPAKPVPQAAEPVSPPCSDDMPFTLVESRDEVKRVLAELGKAELLYVDLETAALAEYADDPRAALDPHRARIRLLQVSAGERVYLFDLDRVPLSRFASLFQCPWIAHNAVFDLAHLLHAGLKPQTPYCTLLADNATCNRRLSLVELYETCLNETLDKSHQQSDWSIKPLSEAQLRYAARDVGALVALWARLKGILTPSGERLAQLLYEAQHAVALMELNGIGFDTGAHARIVRRWEKKRAAALKALKALKGPENPNSTAQVAAYFEANATKAQLKSWPRTGGGQLSTATDELAMYADVPAVAAYLEYRRWNDHIKSHGEKLLEHLNPATGRFHPRFTIAAARTGRMSASSPNVQGLPREREFRALFVPRPGNVFVRADYNQMQLRIAALLSGDARLLGAYERGDDVHRLTAARVLGKKVEQVTDAERSLAKAIAFGILFGMGSDGLRRYALSSYGTVLSAAEAGRIRARFFENYPDLARWQKEQVAEAERSGCSVTPMHRVRRYTGPHARDFHTKAMNTPIQGGEAEVMLAALALLPEALQPLGAVPVNCVHDELLVECPKDKADAVESALRCCMEQGMLRVFPRATLNGLVESARGANWGDAK